VRTGGDFCLVLLVLNAVFCIFAYAFDNSAIRQAAYGTMLTGGTVLWGLGVALCRKMG
jgi:hypothetical protein